MSSNWRSPTRPVEKLAEQGRPYNLGIREKSAEGERVADGFEVAMKRGNARRAKGPCCSAMLLSKWEARAR